MLAYRATIVTLLPVAIILVFSFLVTYAHPVGIYGVHQDYPELSQHQVDTVFTPLTPELIHQQAATGRKVFLSLNVFGGTEPWNEFPDSIPIMSDGQKLPEKYGGICPTHSAWRANRLALLTGWLSAYIGENGISGLWLDFLRYPGRWEQPHPEIVDSCYCPRCLALFQSATDVVIPQDLFAIRDKAAWIRQHAGLQWMQWKKETIASFVREARAVLDQHPEKKKLKLGVFLVPWRKSDFDGALSFQLAQDAELFKPYVDVFSPMVYHRMVGQPVEWVGELTAYYKEMTEAGIWPIIQVEDVPAEELERTVTAAADAGAERAACLQLFGDET